MMMMMVCFVLVVVVVVGGGCEGEQRSRFTIIKQSFSFEEVEIFGELVV